MKHLSPFDYYAPSSIIKDGFDSEFVILGIFIIVISIIGAYIIIEKRYENIIYYKESTRIMTGAFFSYLIFTNYT